ncbi:MAG: hypothetical protein MUF31_04185 [Akkermansiaceae bacterium]|nr:hypothetical protein [Akkermansiaceae bacterium]
MSKSLRDRLLLGLLVLGLWSCAGGSRMHRGAMALRWVEMPPGSVVKCASRGGEKMAMVAEGEGRVAGAGTLRSGDVIAFYMGHREARRALLGGKIQKIPYELFQFGHLALVVEDPAGKGGLKLLQIAMGESANVDHGLEYLRDKRWRAYRPERVDTKRLREFSRRVIGQDSAAPSDYDYPGVLGWRNVPSAPETRDEVATRYSCTTLVVAALHYAGYEMQAVNRGGRLDIVTPRQVIESRGTFHDPRMR